MSTKKTLSSDKSKQKNIQILLDAFHDGKELTNQEIQDYLHCNRQSVYNYLKALKQSGLQINTKKKGKTQYFSLEDSQKYYQPVTYDTIRSYCIIQGLQQETFGKTSPSSFRRKFLLPCDSDDCNAEINDTCSDRIPLDIGQTQFYNLRNKLLSSGEIIWDPVSDQYCLSGKNIPLIWSLNIDKLYDIYNIISNIPPDSAYYKQFSSLAKKMEFLMGTSDDFSIADSNYLVYGRSHTAFKNMAENLAFLNKYDYQNHLLNIQYTDHNHTPREVTLGVGLIVYCLEKDAIYLIGENFSEKYCDTDSKYIIINLARITQIQDYPVENKNFNAREYLDIYETMFSISIAPPVSVTVEFDLFGNIEHKVQILHSQRPRSRISFNAENTRIIYTDQIRGLNDFAAYLRQFGKAVHVQSPQELKEKMLFSIRTSLQRYMEVQND